MRYVSYNRNLSISNIPNVIIHDTKEKSFYIIDVTISGDKILLKKIAGKITKLRDLEIEIKNTGT